MEVKETSSKSMHTNKIVEDVNYFKYIFKKTEKISCAVFYILRKDSEVSLTDTVLMDLEDTALTLLDVSLESLKGTESTIRERASELRFALISLESKLRVAHAARHLDTEVLGVFLHEIDSVYRSLKHYVEEDTHNPLAEDTQSESTSREYPRKVREGKQIRDTRTVTPPKPTLTMRSRRDRITDFLKDNKHATIKDIMLVINDCSEKTIQRELIAMIKDNQVIREGERRWSKYSLSE